MHAKHDAKVASKENCSDDVAAWENFKWHEMCAETREEDHKWCEMHAAAQEDQRKHEEHVPARVRERKASTERVRESGAKDE
eukprot:12030052-Ditylum_brightwellii.AAC.1